MKRSERRAQLLRHINAYDRDYLNDGSEEETADRILAEEELLMRERWEPEEEDIRPIPRRIELSGDGTKIFDPENQNLIASINLKMIPEAIAHQKRVYPLLVAAYNREREEEEAAAAVGPDFDAKLAQVAGEELQAAIDRAVEEERERQAILRREMEQAHATAVHERALQAMALARLARGAGVTYGMPDAIVENVLAKLKRLEDGGEGRWGAFAHERNVKAVECELALSRLAKEAGVPDDGPDEIVNEVLAKLNAKTDKEGERSATADFPGSIEYSVRYDPEGVGVLGVLEGDQPWRSLTAAEAKEAARRWRLTPSLQEHLLECETALHRLRWETGVGDGDAWDVVGRVLEKLTAKPEPTLAAAERISERVARTVTQQFDDPRIGPLGTWMVPFSTARNALDEVRLAFEEALRRNVSKGEFINKRENVTVELQWPWYGGYPERHEHDFRFSVEIRYNPKPVESKK